MKIETANYEFSHGRKPKGLGLWMFMIQRRPGEWTDFQANGTYAEASRKAKAEAKTIGGASKIVVCP